MSVSSMKNGFLVVPFRLPPHGKLDSEAFHYMFIKKHESKVASELNCLFLVNIPLLTSVDSLKRVMGSICSKYDTVSHIEDLLYNDEFGLNEVDLSALTSDLLSTGNLDEKRFTPRNTALLKFVDQSSVNNCFNALKKYSNVKKEQERINWEYNSPSVDTFLNFYKPINLEYLKEEVYSHLALFEAREQEAQENAQTSIVDEDGFTLVVGKNTKNLNSIRKKILNSNPLSKHENKIRALTMVDKKAKQDFYRFQVRERKKQEINQLLNKFKDDQERIKVMKAKKKFNPYKNSL
ncbi:Rrp7p KNAG_0C00490 [Huiozyma naganishii CBS 8797]|uniref:Ribosomal RNA-processing protein 7 C-terminal domain-containing protein n=1 Tax=Huiozyma naganishii (strain ATCC MYA-139 / BCRC 22969 / CBS 8797 / KCTC 17520 / NBRC 10181 / NCYC 3082 / Yp74L-3) TaxID=1071383 RepID=J7RHZ0_HUIN7|nr:hypothetical protein KNAG_0C00490 [Kazachstania naganishii CBS 8797]CCK69163.1 hypothetical protein KNAG_0C00490 [Kazachstania naganishii CBS 8797]